MNNATAILSMLHEPADPNSAVRYFRQQPVLSWTLQRLAMSEKLGSLAIICWDDQLESVQPIAADRSAYVLVKTPRQHIPAIESVAAARRWADGWRGGLLNTCDFDLGFYAPWIVEVAGKLDSDAILLVDPAAAMVDPKLIDKVIAHADSKPDTEIVFAPAACGLAPALIRSTLAARLGEIKTHPGRLLHYLPDQPMRDPLAGDGCVSVPTPIARSTRNFRLDSQRQVERITDAAIHLNGQLMQSDAEDLLSRLAWTAEVDPLPREVVIELNTNRETSPIFWPGRSGSIQRPPMSLSQAEKIFRQIVTDDMRLTIAGVGDPLLHENFFEILDLAKSSGIPAIHVETDLLAKDSIEKLAESDIDVVSMHLPAMTPQTYAAVMSVDRFGEAIENIRRFIVRRGERCRGVPILTPLFMKCQLNLVEMESWYDQWVRAVGSAVILGPSDFAGLIENVGTADMSPPKRRPCSRLWSRMMILSDGKVASCEQDVLGRQIVGDATSQSIEEIWQRRFKPIRAGHKNGSLVELNVCNNCSEWHRP